MTTLVSPISNNYKAVEEDEDDMLDKQLGTFIEKEERHQHEINQDNKTEDKSSDRLVIHDDDDTDDEQLDKQLEEIEKGQKETSESKERTTDDEDSETDIYTITDDQKRALKELVNQKTDLGIQDEEPPEYNVKERLIELNEELANDPTPVEKQSKSRVNFKDNVVDLVAPPPPDYDEEDEIKPNNKNQNNSSPTQETEEQSDMGDTTSSLQDSTDDSGKKRDKVLIEREGKFELVSSDDVTANDLGILSFDDNKENVHDGSYKKQPSPPSKPRPSTANGTASRRIILPKKSQRPHSASPERGSALNNFKYDSPYALSEKQKEMGKERKKRLEKQQKEDEEKKKYEEENRKQDNDDAFQCWLKQAREREKKRKQMEEEQKKKKEKTENEEDKEEAYKTWLKTKQSQIKQEKLLQKRAEQEAHEGYYARPREECNKAFRTWLKKKYEEAKKSRSDEKQRARIHRLATRRLRKSRALAGAVQKSNGFRYVDYYGYRY